MEVIRTDIDGLLIIEPRVFADARGYFFESFSQREFDEKVAPLIGGPVVFVQDNESRSTYGVVRGLHFQKAPYAQSKIVRCVRGRVLDIALDLRPGSPTYLKHAAVEISEETTVRYSSRRGSHTALPCFPTRLCSNTNAMSRIILKPNQASILWMSALA